MARPPIPVESYGAIWRRTINGKPTAGAYYRDSDGKRRPMTRQGKTEADAERRLREALRDRLTPTYELLTRDSTLGTLADVWVEEIERSKLATNTKARYTSSVRAHVRPVGELRLREVTVPRLQRLIDRVADGSGEAQARMVGVVLAGMFKLAVRHGAIASNPASVLLLPAATTDDVRAPGVAEIRTARAAFAAYDALPRRRADAVRELTDIFDMLTATGARIGEVLALDWSDIDLEAGTVSITATVVGVSGEGLRRQPNPKSERSRRRLALPRYAVDMLTRRRVAAYSEHVFPSANGSYRWPENVRVAWAAALKGTDVAWMTTKSCRKAVATMIEAVEGIEAAKDQLGHKSSQVTSKHYVPERIDRPDRSKSLQTLGESDE